ncbi:Hypp8647 [Branchiostoma lanceolatum]|uniref:Hypp8647 protein n=1 Tax=Branchiostoma lanceolatum TaxID=7740 RepID=A0A8K0EI07_BRALA|nr:Hypp8647 [Branchiostoma lanceolatum]
MGCEMSTDSQTLSVLRNRKNRSEFYKRPGDREDWRLPLDAWQRFYLQKSWKTVARKSDRAASTVFLTMLQDNPGLRQKWPRIRVLTDEEIPTSPYIKFLGERIFDCLDYIIDNLSDLDHVISELTKLGRQHADMKVMTPEDVWAIEAAFLAGVQECLEDRFTTKYEEIYSRFIVFVIETMVIGFDPH